MKLAVSTYSLSRWRRENGKTLEDTIDAIARMGVEGIEFVGLDDAPVASSLQRAGQLRKRCEKRRLKIVSYCTSAELLVPPNAQRKEIARLKEHVDIVAALGAPSMRHDITRGFGEWSSDITIRKTFANVLKTVVPAIREVADYAKCKNVRTSLENHGYYMQAARRVEQLIKAVDHPNSGLTLDLGNFLAVNDDPIAAVKRLAKYAQMVHAKDFHFRKKQPATAVGWFNTSKGNALLGAIVRDGVINVAKQIATLKKANYDGFISLEFEGIEEPLSAVRQGLDYLRKLL